MYLTQSLFLLPDFQKYLCTTSVADGFADHRKASFWLNAFCDLVVFMGFNESGFIFE